MQTKTDINMAVAWMRQGTDRVVVSVNECGRRLDFLAVGCTRR